MTRLNTILLVLLAVTLTKAQDLIKVKGEFDYCLDSYHKNPIDVDEVCTILSYRMITDKQQKEINEATKILGPVINGKNNLPVMILDVYTKESLSIEGVGYECEVKIDHWKYGLTFFGYKWQTVTEEIKILEPRECAQMKLSKECNGEPMKCADGICEYREANVDDYSYFYTIDKEVRSCYLKQRTIVASSKESHLFGTDCIVTDNYCRLVDSVIVWEKNIIKTCPFRRLLKGIEFELNGSTLKNKEHLILFSMRHVETYCGTTMIRTFEGAYVTIGNNEEFYMKTNLPANMLDSHKNNINALSLAQVDYKSYVRNAEIRTLVSKKCETFKTILHSIANTNDRYTRLTDYKKKPVIVYSLYGELYRPDCLKVNTIYMKKDNEKCYLDFEITVTINNKNISAFLTHYGIVKTHSQEIKCIKNSIRKIKLPKSDLIIVNKNNHNSLVSAKDFKLDKLTFLNFEIDESIYHDDILKETAFNMLHEINNEKIHDFLFTKKNVFSGSEEAEFTFRHLLIVLGIIGFTFLVIVLMLWCGCRLNCCSFICKLCETKKSSNNIPLSNLDSSNEARILDIEELLELQKNLLNK